jgi:dienelactone hydrolase
MQVHHTEPIRESLTSVLGAPPDPAPLQPEVLDVTAGEGFRREHIKFQVSPGDWSYAYLLVPDNLRSPAPVIYCHHSRSTNFKSGKTEIVTPSGERNYAVGVDLVQRGYVVFAPDAIGFGERRSPESDGDTFDTAYTFHQLALRVLRGETLLKKVLWDVSRGIDYLETRSEVDSRYIGFMGEGYGGRMALWASAIEPRIRAAVAHGGVTTYREQLRRREWFQAEFVVPRLMQVADTHHVLGLIAPRPFLMSVSDGEAQTADAEEIYLKASAIYQKYGASNRLGFYLYKNSKSFEPNMRFNAYSWLDSWLLPY